MCQCPSGSHCHSETCSNHGNICPWLSACNLLQDTVCQSNARLRPFVHIVDTFVHVACSLSAMIVNHFKMRSDVLSYNLGGMGCSAGVIAIGLAEKMLQVKPRLL